MAAPVGPVWYSGNFCDVASHPDGYVFAVASPSRTRVTVYKGDLTGPPTVLWLLDLTIAILWLRVAVDPGTGDTRCFATTQDDRPILIESTGETILTGGVVQQRATLITYESGDFVAYINRSAFTYTRWPLSGADPGPVANPFTSSGTSQGFLDVIGGSIRWANTYAGGVDTGALTFTYQGTLIRYPDTQGGITVGQSQGNAANPDAGYVSRDGNAIIQRIIPTLCHEIYAVPFGNGDAAWAIAARTPTVNGGNACLVIAPPWSGAIIANGTPTGDSGSGGAGTPTSNTISTVRRPTLPKSATPKTYPHVVQMGLEAKGLTFDRSAAVHTGVRDALAAGQQSVRLLWDSLGQVHADLKALRTASAEQAQTNLRMTAALRDVNQLAQQALAVGGKVTAQQLPYAPGPTLPPPDDQVGGPPAPPPGGGSVVIPGTSDAIAVEDITWVGLNVANWPIGATLTSIAITASQVCLDYTGKNTWPAVDPTGDGVLSPGNPWVIANIGGTWYASTYEWLRVGQICKNVTGPEFQDYVTGTSPLDTWTPALGEIVGFMVSSLARNGPQSPVNQRTQIATTAWPF